MKNFLRRNPALSPRFAENVKTVRAAVSEKMLREYINHLECTLENTVDLNNTESTNENVSKEEVNQFEIHYCSKLFFLTCTLHLLLVCFFFQIVASDFILLHFLSKRTGSLIKYVAQVEEKLPNNKYFVTYLKQYENRENEFVFPQALLQEQVNDDDIISVLPHPTVKRGRFIFSYYIL